VFDLLCCPQLFGHLSYLRDLLGSLLANILPNDLLGRMEEHDQAEGSAKDADDSGRVFPQIRPHLRV